MGLKQKAVSGVKWNTVTTVYCMALQILRLSILTYLLDKSDFGLIAIAMMVISFTDIFSELGLTVAIIHKQNITNEQYSSAYWMNVVLHLVMFFFLWMFSPAISNFYSEPILKQIIPLLGIQILLNAFGKIFQTIKTKELQFGFISKVRMIAVTIGFVVTILLAWKGLGVFSLVYGQLVQVAVNQGVYAIEGVGKQKIRMHFRFNEIKDFIKIGAFQLGSQVLDFLSAKIDILLIGRFFGMDDLGIYNIAKDLMLKPYHIISSLVNNVASSAFARIQNNIMAIKENYKRVVKIITLLCIFIYIAMFVFADTIVSILYAAEFSSVALFLRILVVIGIINSINGQAGILQVALGRTDIGFKWTLIRVICSLVVILLSSFFTIYTVAYTQMLLSIIFFFVYWRLVVFPLSTIQLREYLNIFKESFLVSIVISLPFYAVLTLFVIPLWGQIALGVLFAIFYAAYYKLYRGEYVNEIYLLVLNKKRNH